MLVLSNGRNAHIKREEDESLEELLSQGDYHHVTVIEGAETEVDAAYQAGLSYVPWSAVEALLVNWINSQWGDLSISDLGEVDKEDIEKLAQLIAIHGYDNPLNECSWEDE